MKISYRHLVCGFAPVLAALAGTVASAAPNTSYPQPSPSNDEQYMLELTNAARANPVAEGVRLAAITDASILQYYKYYSLNTIVMTAQFATYKAKAPLALNSALMASARQQSLDQAANGFQGHNSSNGTTFDARITAAGYKWSTVGENVYAYSQGAYFCHVGFNADWGVPSLDHRANIMNTNGAYADFREIGISSVPTANTKIGPQVVTQDFATPASSGTAYLVGVVYNDADGSGSYNPGEGLGGVTVMPDGGTYYAATSDSGGFVIPLPTTGSGTMTITANGGGLGGSRVKTVSWTAGVNVKVDFTTADPVSASATTTTTASLPNSAAFLSGSQALGNGVYYLAFANGSYFGYFGFMADPNFIYHFDMGYEYILDGKDSSGGVYLYDFKSNGWFYTSASFSFPYMYDFSRKSMVYYFPDSANAGRYNTNGVRYFYDCTTKEIFSK